MQNIRKKQTILKTVMYFSDILSCIFIKKFVMQIRRNSVSLRDCFSFNVKSSVIGLEECNNIFSQFFPVHPAS